MTEHRHLGASEKCGMTDVMVLAQLLASLDESISSALREALFASASSVPPKRLGVEMFLCAFHQQHAGEILAYFTDSHGFALLHAALWPKELSSDPSWTVEQQATDLGPNTALGYHIEMDSELERVFVNAARISFALLRKNTSMPDLIASIATEVQICESLHSKWGISLKGLLAFSSGV